jgi:hypothetical protein
MRIMNGKNVKKARTERRTPILYRNAEKNNPILVSGGRNRKMKNTYHYAHHYQWDILGIWNIYYLSFFENRKY